MRRTADSCESKLSELKLHKPELAAQMSREIEVENFLLPTIKDRFEREVAAAVAAHTQMVASLAQQ